ncbi:hypothetical protein GQ44DRAFT_702305 [Phaeosphaeriaceae sp. PMI808]|nr:hypothetical protein GQ44DRAFT_702305 [Phaeosphaeriaceae sp. PMI808]
MGTIAVPGTTTISRRPLSNHGMPKPPRVTSPDRPHRFSGPDYPSHPTISALASPRSPGPMSPPMSARSFGTFIDSAPSTPAYSPRMDYDWDSSTLVLLRPASSSSEPSSPTEPSWDMIAPMKKPQQAFGPLRPKVREPSAVTKEVTLGTQLASPPVKKVKPLLKIEQLQDTKVIDFSQKENAYPNTMEVDGQKPMANQPTGNNVAPFGKLASKMKLMLRRTSTDGKQKEKKKEKKEKDYYSPVENVHWSEM